MSPAEKWGVFFGIIGVVALGGGAWWKFSRWKIEKIDEYETTSLENIGRLRAEFNAHKNSADVDEATRKIFQNYYGMFTQMTNKVIKKELSFAELRTLNKKLIAADIFLQQSFKIASSEKYVGSFWHG